MFNGPKSRFKRNHEEGLNYLKQIINDPEFESQQERLNTNLQHFTDRLNGN